MEIALITDLHVGLANQETRGIDTRANFLRVMKRIQEKDPKYVIIAGDLAYKEPDTAVYRWIRDQLESFDIEYFIIAGNHDDSNLMSKVFGVDLLLKNGELYFRNDINRTTVLYLDTSRGNLSHTQLKWIDKQLAKSKGYCIIVMHHPLLPTHTPFMENNHRLINPKPLIKRLRKYKYPVHIFCGHYHIDKASHMSNIHQYITPSCFVQIKPDEEDFKVDHKRIAIRWLDLENDYLITSLEYLDGAISQTY